MSVSLRDVTGFRGERMVELALTNYAQFSAPLFTPAFLGDKWEAIDLFVELRGVPGKRPYFFAQVKTTSRPLTNKMKKLSISSKKKDIERLLEIPGPTYLIGVHESTQRVFLKSIHAGTPISAITRISLSNELTPHNLKALHTEVQTFSGSRTQKPVSSLFN